MNLSGVDIEWVRQRIDDYMEQTTPATSTNSSYKQPACGREEAIKLTEVMLPILDRLYPGWESENKGSRYYEFTLHREAARRLRARLDTADEVATHLGMADSSPTISASGMHTLIWKAAEAQWLTGHRHEAVLAASKAVNSMLQQRVGRRDISETDLVKQALSDKEPEEGKSRLRFDVGDEQTNESLRQGVMQFGSGCFQAIRNPLGHLPNEEIELSEQTALERMAALSLFARWIDEAVVVTYAQGISRG